MKEHGGFEHNSHALRIVQQPEYRYPDFSGLNLTWEVRQAIALHSQRRDSDDLREFANAGHVVLSPNIDR